MSARSLMTHRATLKRPVTSTNDWNQPSVDSLSEVEVIACRVYRKEGKLVIADDKTARVDEIRVMFPLDLDVRTEDELSDIKDRQDNLLFNGPFVVRNPVRLRRHKQATLEGHGIAA